MSQENVELARRGLDALNHDGLDAVIDLCDPEVEWIAIPGFLPDAEDFHGHAGVRAWFDKVGATLKEVQWEAQEITRRQAAARDAGEELEHGRAGGDAERAHRLAVLAVKRAMAVIAMLAWS